MDCRRLARCFAAALATALLPALAGAQVIVDPNQIRGDVTHTSTDPAVLAYLSEVSVPSAVWTVRGTSMGLPTSLVQTTTVSTSTRSAAAYELTVESSGPGIAYDMSVSRSGANGMDFYEYGTRTSGLVHPEPAADVELDFAECAALIRVDWTLPDGTPVPVATAKIEAYRETQPGNGNFSVLQAWANAPAGATSGRVLVRGDSAQYVLVVKVTTGSDSYTDRIKHVARAHGTVPCDRTIVLRHPVPRAGNDPGGAIEEPQPTDWLPALPPGAGGVGAGGDGRGTPPPPGAWTGPYTLGRITGTFDILGEHEHRIGTGLSRVAASLGPFDNDRLDLLESDPSSGAYALENLPPSALEGGNLGNYHLRAFVGLRAGDGYENMMTVGCGTVVPIGGSVDAADTLVIAPAYFAGDVFFAQPQDQAGRTGTLLDDLRRLRGDPVYDPDGDGIPTQGLVVLSRVTTMGYQTVAPPGCASSSTTGTVDAAFGGAVRAGDSSFVGSYEVVVGGLGGLGSRWNPPQIALDFLDDATPELPLTFHDSFVGIRPDVEPINLDPGERLTRPFRYCFGELRLTFRATSGTFIDPQVRTSVDGGRMVGLDFEGQPADYFVNVTSNGTPLGPTSNARSDGLVVALLPEADYVLQPRVTSVDPGGGTSSVQLTPIAVRVGCGQVVEGHTDFITSLLPLPRCLNAATVRLEGSVLDLEPIARVSASVDGGPSVDACAPCGMNPTFAVDVPVVPGINTIVVTAEEASGRTASVTTRVHVAMEPSAIDLRPASEPLRVRKEGDDRLTLTWEATAGVLDHVYQGTIASLHVARTYDHGAAGACSAADGTASIALPAADAYFLVGSPCGDEDTSLGRDSFGRERLPAAPSCP